MWHCLKYILLVVWTTVLKMSTHVSNTLFPISSLSLMGYGRRAYASCLLLNTTKQDHTSFLSVVGSPLLVKWMRTIFGSGHFNLVGEKPHFSLKSRSASITEFARSIVWEAIGHLHLIKQKFIFLVLMNFEYIPHWSETQEGEKVSGAPNALTPS